MTNQKKIQISSSPRVVENEKGEGVREGESYRLYVVLGGIPFWTSLYYGDAEQQQKSRAAAQADVKTPVEVQCTKNE